MNFGQRLLISSVLLSVLSACQAEAQPDYIKIDDFHGGLNEAWRPKSFSGETSYHVVSINGNQVLHALSEDAASGLVYEIEFDVKEYPILQWRWKISNIIKQGDSRQKSGDDYAARVYVIFPHWFFPKTRTLNYIWANRLPEGSIQPNAFTGNAMMLAVESGPEKVGQWVREKRNILHDFRRAFGEDPPMAGAIAVMTDTDNTGAKAEAWYDDFELHSQ